MINMIINHYRYRQYYPKYDVKDKILSLQGKVPVSILMEIKYLNPIN